MKQQKDWSRRKFVQWMGYTSAIGAVGLPGRWLSASPLAGAPTSPRFAFAGSTGKQHGIQVFSIKNDRWSHVQTIASENPSALALHPSERFLYAVNEIDSYQSLPTGTVEAYSIDPHSGRLTLLNRQPLSLSGVLPRHLAVSPDGRTLAVAVHGGGAYNLLPIGEDGRLDRVSAIIKETGSGPHADQDSAHPQMVVFDRSGSRLLSADLGSDTLSVLDLNDDGLSVASRSQAAPGSGPRQMALHPSGNLLYVVNELDASLSCFGYDATSGSIRQRLHHTAIGSCSASGVAAMAMHPAGNVLYTSYCGSGAGSLSAWRIDAASGALKPVRRAADQASSLQIASMVAAHDSLFVLDHKQGILRLPASATSGRLGQPVQVARIEAPVSLALKYS
ncbi:MAG TPA: beta-propeller fold lactonase family protein [Edaphobacter sp.]|nr:beta-propeller fold lactonase family protein [Edaphobacter sp.]